MAEEELVIVVTEGVVAIVVKGELVVMPTREEEELVIVPTREEEELVIVPMREEEELVIVPTGEKEELVISGVTTSSSSASVD